MKFLHYIALIGGAMAVKLHQHTSIGLATPPQHSLVMTKVKNMAKLKTKVKSRYSGLGEDFEHAFEAWGEGKL